MICEHWSDLGKINIKEVLIKDKHQNNNIQEKKHVRRNIIETIMKPEFKSQDDLFITKANIPEIF